MRPSGNDTLKLLYKHVLASYPTISSGLKSATAKGSSATTLLSVHSVSCREGRGEGREREREGQRVSKLHVVYDCVLCYMNMKQFITWCTWRSS